MAMNNLPIIEKGKTYLIALDKIGSEKELKDFINHWESVTGTKAVILHKMEIIAELKDDKQK